MPVTARRFGATTAELGYGRAHRDLRARLQLWVDAGEAKCVRCGEPIAPGERWDLGHVDGDRWRHAGPEHIRCNRATASISRRQFRLELEPEPERDGLAQSDSRWRVPWLKGLLDVPADATWPRLMTVPHPDAVGSLGGEFAVWAEMRSGRPLRWWQQLVAARLLEVDAAGRLVWETLLLSLARQLGKSWLLRELCMWRIHQGDLFGGPQTVMHVAKDLAVCREVQRPARRWAAERQLQFRVREANGQEEIEYRLDGSRWMLGSKQQGGYGFSVDFAPVDEVWKVDAKVVEEGLEPTMVERDQAQLMLVSTAHRLATPLMIQRRAAALEELETGRGDLLVEWSAVRGAEMGDRKAWRQASPHWTPKRERLLAAKVAAAEAGEVLVLDEVDPEASFRSQWLNEWPARPSGVTEALLPPGLWAKLTEPGVGGDGPLFVAMEDGSGNGAALVAATVLADGRIEVDGWMCQDWGLAIESFEKLKAYRWIRHLQVGASLLSSVPQGTVPTARPAGSRETRLGLPLLRELAAGGMVVHDETTQHAEPGQVSLDAAVMSAMVKDGLSGLVPAKQPGTPLVKALVWAVQAAYRPAAMPAIY